jgi:acyl-coenzyme A thioesterase PaaI-like protein
MTENLNTSDTIDPATLRRRVLTAIASNRAPGFHFPGYFLAMSWPRLSEQGVTQVMDAGPHCIDVRGVIHHAAVGVMVDGGLSMTPRMSSVAVPGARQATVHIDLQYSGHEPRGALHMEATLEGFMTGHGVRQAYTRGVLLSDGQAICHATGAFVVLPPPPGVKLAPLPWQREGAAAAAPIKPRDLDPKERGVLRAANRAMTSNDATHSFIEHFWDIMPKQVTGGASCRVKIGAQIGNRVGHVQGGILLGIAQATASAAVPDHPKVSNISAWYISPGSGKALTARSRVIHAGRSFAIVRTEVKNADGSRVLEAVSNHTTRA